MTARCVLIRWQVRARRIGEEFKVTVQRELRRVALGKVVVGLGRELLVEEWLGHEVGRRRVGVVVMVVDGVV